MLIAQRHEALRTRIVIVGGIPHQLIDTDNAPCLAITDLSNLSLPDAEREAQRLAQEFVEERVELSVGPLFAARLWTLSTSDSILILGVDHIVSDGVSFGILSRELWTLYNQGVRGVPISLPQPRVQFTDYALWQHQTHKDWEKRHAPYWHERLIGAPHARIPPDKDGSEEGAPIGARLSFSFGEKLSAELRAAARRERTLLALIMLTVYAVVLSRWCAQDDFVLVFISHGRYGRPGLDDMIGFAAHDLYLRVQIATDDTLGGLLKRLQMELSRAYEHLDFDRAAAFVSECNREPLFNWQNTHGIRKFIDKEWTLNETITLRPFALRDLWPAKFSPAFYDTGSDIALTVYYRSDLFSPVTLDGFTEDLEQVAAHLARQSTTAIASLSLKSGTRSPDPRTAPTPPSHSHPQP
jgi:hypothetical protein